MFKQQATKKVQNKLTRIITTYTNQHFTIQQRHMAFKPPGRVIPAGLPKGLPPKVVTQQIKLTPAEMQAEEDRLRFVVKTFYKTGVKWKPHPKLAACNNVQALEHYLWDHHQRLRWFRGKIADTSNRNVRRSYLRTHISIHKLNVKYIENKIFQLKGELRIPKLYEPLAPNFHDKVNPFMNQVKIVERVPQRTYDYPLKDKFEPIAQEGPKWIGSLAARVKQI